MFKKTGSQGRAHKSIVAAGLLAATVAGGAFAQGASASGLPTFSAVGVNTNSPVGYTMVHTGDTIHSTVTNLANPSAVELHLFAASNVTWWKSVRVVDAAGNNVFGSSTLWTQDGVGDDSPLGLHLNSFKGKGFKIVFSQAKTFGAHTDMFQLNLDDIKPGQRVDFTWLQD